jgi:hypothetical protein
MSLRGNTNIEMNSNFAIMIAIGIFLTTILIVIAENFLTKRVDMILPTVYDVGQSTSVHNHEPPTKRMRKSPSAIFVVDV